MKKEILEIYNEVFRDTDGVELLTKSESKFIRTYMKTKDTHENNRHKNKEREN